MSASFGGEVAVYYKKIFDNHRRPNGPWKKMVDIVREYVKQLPEAAPPKILDLASGPGEPAASLAKMLKATGREDAVVYSTDVASDMVDKAKDLAEKEEVAEKVKCLVVDAQDIEGCAELKDEKFDVITICYGYMFCPELEKAVEQTYKALKPGGLLVSTHWVKMPYMMLCKAVMTAVMTAKGLEPPTAPPSINPMSLSQGQLMPMLEKQGFVDLQVEENEYSFTLGQDREEQYGMATIPIRDKVEKLEAHDLAKEKFPECAEQFTTTDESGDMIMGGMVYALVTCKKAAT
ncbi:unnamed protein product [Amoebophrya sp. A25]|nr:unnamed protein product [Amoebophrya sp. A25]|eukprot:GSA25T00018655001.1